MTHFVEQALNDRARKGLGGSAIALSLGFVLLWVLSTALQGDEWNDFLVDLDLVLLGHEDADGRGLGVVGFGLLSLAAAAAGALLPGTIAEATEGEASRVQRGLSVLGPVAMMLFAVALGGSAVKQWLDPVCVELGGGACRLVTDDWQNITQHGGLLTFSGAALAFWLRLRETDERSTLAAASLSAALGGLLLIPVSAFDLCPEWNGLVDREAFTIPALWIAVAGWQVMEQGRAT